MTTMPVRIGPEAPVSEVAQLMREQDIGDVLIMDGERLMGIVTDRDIIVRVLADGRGPESPVHMASSLDLVVIGAHDGMDEAARLMRQHKLRRLPVVDDGRVVGVVTLGDLAQVRDPGSVLGQISVADPTL